MAKKLLFVDVETTGTEPDRHGLVQVAGILEVDGTDVEEFDLKMAPFPNDEISGGALQKIKKTEEEVRSYPDPYLVHGEIVQMLSKHADKYDKADKFDLVGFNSTFDDGFLRRYFNKCGDKYYGSFVMWPSIDVAVLAAAKLVGDRAGMKDFKLETVATKFGIPLEEGKAHDALYDVRLAREIYRKVTA